MRIGIDISQIVYQGTGVARFTDGLVNAILKYDKKNDWLFFFSSLRRKLDKRLEYRIVSSRHRLKKLRYPPTALSFLWNTLHGGDLINLTGPLDLFITSDWTEPPTKSIKKATIVHDLVYLRYPQTVDPKILNVQRKRLGWVQKESNVIFADSNITKDDLESYLKIDEKRIHVIYPGVETEKITNSNTETLLKKYNLSKPFILSVGKIEPRKNLKRLITAFNRLAMSEITLAIVGKLGWENLDDSLLTNNVRFLGYVPDPHLYLLYSSCLFFVYPSIWEGFGYPVIEAMKLGAPVATSNTSSLKEISQDATLLFDPFDVKEIASAIKTLIKNKKLREDLKKKGLERSKIFTWKRYYDEMIRILQLQTP